MKIKFGLRLKISGAIFIQLPPMVSAKKHAGVPALQARAPGKSP